MTKSEWFKRGLVVAAVIAIGAGCRKTSPTSEGPVSSRPSDGLPVVYTEWPFDSTEAARRQDETADRLGVPKDLTLDCGNGISMKLVLIPAGEFVIGSPSGESGHNTDEGLQHRVHISKPFYMGVYEITQNQYKAVTGGNPSKFKDPGGSVPVETVAWDDATSFCRKLSVRTGWQVRLPTEAQWEYVCRAGTDTALNSGRAVTFEYRECRNMDAVGWYVKNSDATTHAVGQKAANAFGLYDMHGNVHEWCSDWYTWGHYETFASAKSVDPKGPSSGQGRVVRGGSWHHFAGDCRSAHRSWYAPVDRVSSVGFRVVVNLKSQTDE